MTIIREANSKDAYAIASVLQSLWRDEQTNISRISAILEEPSHLTLVSLANEQIVGFVDCFETQATSSGVRRWEIDLIAVKAAYQRQLIGRQLISAATHIGIKRGMTFARALIATQNLASQRTFARCGYQSDGKIHHLYVSSQRCHHDFEALTNPSKMIPVSTLRYQGLWIEESWTIQRLTAAQQLQKQNNWDVVGAVIPLEQSASRKAAKEAGFELIGQYSWWEYEESKACFDA